MKPLTALGIAEHMWNDMITVNSLSETLKQFGLNPDNLSSPQSQTMLQANGSSIREEVIARWANIILALANAEDEGKHYV